MKEKINLLVKSVVVIAVCVTVLAATKVSAAGYEPADIDRVYITCDTDIKNLKKENYVEAKIDVVKADGTVDIGDASARVKVRGNSTSKAEKKPVNIKFSSKVSLLGMEKGKKWNVLANAFDKTLIRNALCLDLGNKMGLSYISNGRFVDLYYNDALCGSYYVTEPVETGDGRVEINEEGNDFMIELERERYESDVTYVNTKNGLRFAINAPEVPSDTQYNNITNYITKMETSLKTYRMSEYSKYIDVDSFVNYYIVCEIFKAVDFNYSSTRFYCKNNKMYAGPLWDADLSSGNASLRFYKDYYKDGVSYKDLYCTQMKWYQYLIKSDEFVQKVNQRMNQMYPIIENMYRTNLKGINQIDLLMNKYGLSFNRNYLSIDKGGAGWSITKRYSVCDNPIGLEYDNHPSTYLANVSMLKSWLNNRTVYLKEQWKKTINNTVSELYAEKKTNTAIYLSWINDGEADGNEIYVSSGKGKYKLAKTVYNGTAQEYIIRKLKPGIKYRFRIRSYVKNSSVKTYSPFMTVSKTIKFKSPKIKVKMKGKQIRLSWNKVNGADGYIVYKKVKNKYKKIKTIKGNKRQKYTIKNVKRIKKKQYKIRAFVKNNNKLILSR